MRKELIDQSAHFMAALVVLSVANTLGGNIGALAGAFIGFCLGFVREITEEGEVTIPAVKSALTSWLDLAFWTLGGYAAGLLV